MRLHPPIQPSQPARGFAFAAALSLAAWAMFFAVLAFIIWLLPAMVSWAHTPSGSATCAGITARMTNAPKDFTTTITLTVDEKVVASDTRDGNWTLSRPVPQDDQRHTFAWVVDGEGTEFDEADSGRLGPCREEPTEPPTTHTTPEPTPTPTEPEETPSPTPSASAPSPTAPTVTPPPTTSTPSPGVPTTSAPTTTPSQPTTSTPSATPSETPTRPAAPPGTTTSPPWQPSEPQRPAQPDEPTDCPPSHHVNAGRCIPTITVDRQEGM